MRPSAMRRSSASRPTSRRTGSKHETTRSEEHTSELQSPCNLVCRLLLEKKNNTSKRSEKGVQTATCPTHQVLSSEGAVDSALPVSAHRRDVAQAQLRFHLLGQCRSLPVD